MIVIENGLADIVGGRCVAKQETHGSRQKAGWIVCEACTVSAKGRVVQALRYAATNEAIVIVVIDGERVLGSVAEAAIGVGPIIAT